MTKKLSFVLLITLLLQFSFTLEAKHLSTQDGIELIPTASANAHAYEERYPPISADVIGHNLTISINQNIGIAQIIIRDSNGAIVEVDNMMSSPNTTYIYISESGYYRIDIIINNGNQYYGYFDIHDGILL